MKPNILLVDDDAIIRATLAELLCLEGFQVCTAENAPAAINLVAERQFDLLIIDLKLPGMDGIEALREIRELTSRIKVIILTGHGSVKSAIDAIHLRVDDYVLKQPGTKDLMERIRKVLAIDQYKVSDEDAQFPVPGDAGDSSGRVHTFKNGVTIDLAKHTIRQGDHDQTLTPTENRLMEIFLENYGLVISHRELVKLLQGYDLKDWEAPEVLRPVISRLRQKLDIIPGGKAWIVSIRGAGYLFEEKISATGNTTRPGKVNNRKDQSSG